MISPNPPIPASSPGYAGLFMRADDFFALGETQERYQLINGVVVMSPSPRPWHWSIVEEVLMQLRDHARRVGVPSGFETYADIDVFIDELTVYQPDLCAYARPKPKRSPRKLTTPPDLVLEVLSPGSKPLDLITKRDAYEKFGVKEYWVIDPDDPDEPGRLRAWSLQRARFVETLVEGDTLASAAIAGFVLSLAPIRALGQG